MPGLSYIQKLGFIIDGEIDDLNDLVEVNTYIANQTQGGFLTVNKLQLLLDNNFDTQQIGKLARHLLGTVTRATTTKAAYIQRVVAYYEARYPALLRRSSNDVNEPYDINSQDMKALALVPDHMEGADGSIIYSSGMMHTKAHLESLLGKYRVPMKVRQDARKVLTLIDYHQSKKVGDFHPGEKLQFGGWKKFGSFVNKWRSDAQDLSFHLKHWLNKIEFTFTDVHDTHFQVSIVETYRKYVEKYNGSVAVAERNFPDTFRTKVYKIRNERNNYYNEETGVNELGGRARDNVPIKLTRERVNLLTAAGFSWEDPIAKEESERSAQEKRDHENNMISMIREYAQTHGHCNIPHPNVAEDTTYNQSYTWLRAIFHKYENGELNDTSVIIVTLKGIGVPFGLSRTKPEHQAGNHYLNEYKGRLVQEEIIKDMNEVRREVPIESGSRGRRLDLVVKSNLVNPTQAKIVHYVEIGELDEHGHRAVHYTEEKEQRKQHAAIAKYNEGVDENRGSLILYVRADIEQFTLFDGEDRGTLSEPGRKIMDKWIDVVKDARERAKSIKAGQHVVELHMINYDINNPHVAENRERIIGPNDDRSTSEEDWATHKTWDRMVMHRID